MEKCRAKTCKFMCSENLNALFAICVESFHVYVLVVFFIDNSYYLPTPVIWQFETGSIKKKVK